MAESMKTVLSSEIKALKSESVEKLLNITYYVWSILGGVAVLYNISEHEPICNLYQKTFLISVYFASIFIRALMYRKRLSTYSVSFVFGEIVNFILIHLCFTSQKDYAIIWSQLGPLVIIIYQSHLLHSIKLKLLLSLKHTLLWTFANYYFENSQKFPYLSMLIAALALFLSIMICFYFENLHDNSLFISEEKVKIANRKLISLIEVVPKSISVISQSMDTIFCNSGLSLFTEECNIIKYLGNCIYHKRKNFNGEENSILEDISAAFSLRTGTRINFGITENKGNLIEWFGRLDLWDEKLALIIVGKEVTKSIKLEKENLENQYKSALLRTVSHELRAPTSTVLTIGQSLLDNKDLSPENNEKASIIVNSCTYMLCLIGDLLDYSQIMAGCLKISSISFNIIHLLHDSLEMFKIELEQKNIKADISVIGHIPIEITSDPYRIKQIIINLLSNAKKFTKNGSITLEVSYDRPKLKLACRDTGIGIDKSQISKLFTVFGKVDDKVNNPEGIGLGLYISNMLVKELGGTGISVESVIGEGTCFFFDILPYDPSVSLNDSEIPDEHSNIILPQMKTTKLIKNIKVLVVDDTYFNVLAYAQMFKNEGITCVYASNGEEAIGKVRENAYDCIVMDCEMPVLDGWESTKKLKRMFKTGEVSKLPPIIAATAHNSDFIKHKCKDSGMDDLIIKPFTKADIISRVRQWAEISRLSTS